MPSPEKPSPDGSVETFHSRFNRVLAVAIWAIDGLLVAGGVVSGTLEGHPALVAPAALLAFAAWLALWHPAVIVDDDDATLVNVIRTVVVPWSALIDVDTKYALTLRTPERAYSAWAAPAPGRAGAAMARRVERGRQPSGHRGTAVSPRPGDLMASESGQAAYMVRTRWQELIAADSVETGIAHEVVVRTNWHWPSIAVLVALAIGSAFALGWA
ncbi:MAG: PH domain-containing protein [Rhodoglobus sp.]